MELILRYFPTISNLQKNQFSALYDLYTEWNDKINVISRKDIENLYEHHVLHSLAIAKVLSFKSGSSVMDVGTGGGFPAIPLAIMFPETRFNLVDSIGKKIKVATEVASAIGLKNCTFVHARAEDIREKYDFAISRAVMPLGDLVRIIKKNIRKEQINAIPNGLICLKGGEINNEIFPFRKKAEVYNISDFFNENYFETKKAIYMPIS